MHEPLHSPDPLANARAAFAAGDWPAAMAAARAALARTPGSMPALLVALDSALRADALADAVPWLESLCTLRPGDARFRLLLAQARREAATRRGCRAGKAR